MTREEAIGKIEYIIDNGQDYGYWTDAQKKALYKAIDALEQEPICEHYFKGFCDRFEDGCFWQCRTERTGEWCGEHKMPDMPRYEWYRCSECSFLSQNVVNYCPNCGAKMGGDTE